jgi:hypothetical protein
MHTQRNGVPRLSSANSRSSPTAPGFPQCDESQRGNVIPYRQHISHMKCKVAAMIARVSNGRDKSWSHRWRPTLTA